MTTGADHRADLVFEGGGVKGIGLGGAFCRLLERGFQPQRVAGTSAGAITAALVAAGYTDAEVADQVLHQVEYRRFQDGSGMALGAFVELLRHKGLHPGRYFEGWMRERLEAKGTTRFGDVRLPPDEVSTGPLGPIAHRLQVVASDVTARRMLVLPHDAREHLGVDPDELEIAHAVRMSMSIPLFFDPVVHRNPGTDDDHLIVDGGLLSNFPVWLFDCQDRRPEFPTFGLLLVPPGERASLAGSPAGGDNHVSLPGYLKAIGQTMMEAHDRLYIEDADYARTIPIDTLGVRTTQFSIDGDGELKERLFESGRHAVDVFLQSWDFAAYRAAFRSDAPAPTRRERVTAMMAAAARR